MVLDAPNEWPMCWQEGLENARANEQQVQLAHPHSVIHLAQWCVLQALRSAIIGPQTMMTLPEVGHGDTNGKT